MKFAAKSNYWSKFLLLPQLFLVILFCLSIKAENSKENNEIENTLQTADQLKKNDRYEQSLAAYQKAESLAVNQKKDSLLAKSLLGQGEVYYLQTKFVHAVSVLKRSVELSEQTDDKLTQAWANNWLGYVYYRLYYYDSSDFFLKRALQIFEQLQDKAGQAIVLSNQTRMKEAALANSLDPISYQAYRNTAAAIHLSAIKLARESGNKESISYSLNNYGNYLSGYQHRESLQAFLEAYQLALESGIKRRIIITEGNVARTYLGLVNRSSTMKTDERLELIKLAQSHFQKAISLAEEIGSDEELFELYQNAAGAFGIENTTALKDYYLKAINVVERLSKSDDGDGISRMRYFQGRTGAYGELASYYKGEGDFLSALQINDKTKAKTLLESLEQKKTGQVSFLSSIQSQSQLNDLQNQLTSLNIEKLNEEKKISPNTSLLAELEKQINQLRQNKLDIQAQLTSTEFSKLPAKSIAGITKADIDKLITDDQTAILVYLSRAELMVITRSRANLIETNIYGIDLFSIDEWNGRMVSKEFSAIKTFKEKIQNQDIDYKDLGKKLYKRFVEPAAKVLKGKSKLIIIPDDEYFVSLPFAALITPDNKHLIEDFSISYAPSLSFLREAQKRKLIENNLSLKKGILAIGDPTFNSKTISIAKTRFRAGDISQLPESKREVLQSAGFYQKGQNKIYTGNLATEEIFKKEADKFRILHLATHGFADYGNPLFSALILADKSQDSDGLLEAWEVMQMNLNADLVILSACETANGRTFQGEGLTGLTWAFLIAGVPTVVASQWKVDSEATADLMIEFHLQLAQNKLSPAEALRQSQLKLLRTNGTKHPFYWASFAAIGKN